MEDPSVVNVKKSQTCKCAEPLPRQLAERKGAAQTICGRCGLPTKIAFRR